jgi:HSP20 family molecular chaperone IbpA
MAVRDLIPWGRTRTSVPSLMPGEEVSPFMTLHREMNRLFDDMLSRFDPGMPSLVGRTPGWAGAGWPSVEVNATDNEVRVSAELPGMDEKDIEVLVDNDVLTIRGEKKSETEDKDRRFSERYYGPLRAQPRAALRGRRGKGRGVVQERRAHRHDPEIRDREGHGEAYRRQCRKRHQALAACNAAGRALGPARPIARWKGGRNGFPQRALRGGFGSPEHDRQRP